ncbi:MAG TPA: FAD-dependent oxidoreductase [Candidatus Dormibacteraeota bacterium]|nr:FAD-dependent oxidoreductase [Candidatus Dormibacteraeota bacterium]
MTTSPPLSGAESASFWLESVGPITPRPRLDRDLEVDVAVVGAGFTGLWTAYELQRRAPALRIALLEAEVAGYGASGRNGSWCIPELNAGPEALARRFGWDQAGAVMRALGTTLDAVASALAEEEVEAQFDRSGVMLVARGGYQVPLLEQQLRSYQMVGMEDGYRWLEQGAARDLLDVAGMEAALYSSNAATLHPGRAVRGLANAVERRGAVIYERTRASRFRPGQPALIETEGGTVKARVVVLGLEAYLAELPQFHRRVLPLYSLITLTEPLSAEQLASVHWSDRICVASMRLSVDYLARTEEGRILVGGRGAPYQFGSRISAANEHHAPTHAGLQKMFGEWFPSLRGVRFTHSWGGVLGMPRDWIPQFGFDPAQGMAFAYGYTGHGVATANLAGRTLADLITGRDTELTRLPLVGHRSPSWEMEPLRWLGVRYVQASLSRLDRRGERTGRPLPAWGLARHLAAH